MSLLWNVRVASVWGMAVAGVAVDGAGAGHRASRLILPVFDL